MPNKLSAARRMRNSQRRKVRNRKAKINLKDLGRDLDTLVKAGKKDEAAAAYRKMSSALDKAAKTGVIPKATANRKRSRLALALNKVK